MIISIEPELRTLKWSLKTLSEPQIQIRGPITYISQGKSCATSPENSSHIIKQGEIGQGTDHSKSWLSSSQVELVRKDWLKIANVLSMKGAKVDSTAEPMVTTQAAGDYA